MRAEYTVVQVASAALGRGKQPLPRRVLSPTLLPMSVCPLGTDIVEIPYALECEKRIHFTSNLTYRFSLALKLGQVERGSFLLYNVGPAVNEL
jgi:hypothetical protein